MNTPTATVDTEAVVTERIGALLEALHLALRTMVSHGQEHPLTVQAAETLANAIDAAKPPFSLQFIGKAVFRDGRLVPLPVRRYRLARFLAAMLHSVDVHELTFEGSPQPDVLRAFMLELTGCYKAETGFDPEHRFECIAWRQIPGAQMGLEVEEVDPDVFTAAQIALAVQECQHLVDSRGGPWDWSRGVAVVRRAERALAKGKEATVRALEIAPGQWSVARRAVAACLHLMCVADSLRVDSSFQRAGAHALLATACTGLEEREGADFQQAATTALERLLEAPSMTHSSVEPHRMKTCALLYAATPREDGGGTAPTGALPLARLCYELERRRCPANASFDLCLADLLALASTCDEEPFDPEWVKALVTAYQEIPPGARVILPDGSRGLVLEAGDQGPLRPKVLVGSQVLIPAGPVRLAPPRPSPQGAAS